MKDQKLETQIRKTQEFIELWHKFRQIYSQATKGDPPSGEKDFLETKELVNFRFEDLMDDLGVKPLKRFLITGFIYEILSIKTLSFMSDEKSKAINKNWENSYNFLNATLARLERKKKRIGSFNKFFVISKKILKGKEIKGGGR